MEIFTDHQATVGRKSASGGTEISLTLCRLPCNQSLSVFYPAQNRLCWRKENDGLLSSESNGLAHVLFESVGMSEKRAKCKIQHYPCTISVVFCCNIDRWEHFF